VRRNSGRGGTGLRNVIRPGDEERMTDIANVANTKLHGEELSSNIPPWVVNVSKANLAERSFTSFQDWSDKPGHLYIGNFVVACVYVE